MRIVFAGTPDFAVAPLENLSSLKHLKAYKTKIKSKNISKIRDSLLSYMAFITIWGSFTTILLPDSCCTYDDFIIGCSGYG